MILTPRMAAPLLALALLTACSDWVDSTRNAIRGWCENTPKYCDVNAVK